MLGDLGVSIDALDLDPRSAAALWRLHIRTVGQLLDTPVIEVMPAVNFDRRMIQEIEAKAYNHAAGASYCLPPRWTLPARIQTDLGASIDVLDLSVRSRQVLKKFDVHTVRQVLDVSKADLMGSGSFGRKSLAELEKKLYDFASGKSPAVALFSGTELGLKQTVVALLASLKNPREAAVIPDRFGLWDGAPLTLRSVAERLGCTPERVRHLEIRGLTRLSHLFLNSAPKQVLEKRMQEAVAREFKEKSGVLSEREILAAIADDCAPSEAGLAIMFLQAISPEGDFFPRSWIEAERGLYCSSRPGAAAYRRLRDRIEAIIREHRRRRPKQRITTDEILTQLTSSGKFPSGRQRLAKRILEVSPTLARLLEGPRRKAASLSNFASAGA